MSKSMSKLSATTTLRDSRNISITLNGLIGDVFRQLEATIDNVQTTEEEQKLVDLLIDALPHERAMYILSKFTGVQDYPLYPETVIYLLEQGDKVENQYPGEIFENGLDFYKEEDEKLEYITIKSLSGDRIDLSRKRGYRNYYSFLDWDVTDNTVSPSVLETLCP